MEPVHEVIDIEMPYHPFDGVGDLKASGLQTAGNEMSTVVEFLPGDRHHVPRSIVVLSMLRVVAVSDEHATVPGGPCQKTPGGVRADHPVLADTEGALKGVLHGQIWVDRHTDALVI